MELGINTFISANGAHIKCGEKVIHKSVLSREIVHDISRFAELHGHGISYFTEDFAMNGIASDNERVMQALSETLNLEKYPEKARICLKRFIVYVCMRMKWNLKNLLKSTRCLHSNVFMVMS